MSGLFGSITIKGNQLTEFAQQTGAVGIPIPFGYGVITVEGNVIFVDKVVTHVTKKKQGKGGVKTESYTYTRSYGVAFCQGMIYGYLTITRNGKVVYTTDPRTSVEDQAFAAKWVQKAALYFGTRDQMPDSTIEAVKGVGQVSGHRDLAYIVLENDDVTDNSGAVPSYQAIIIASPPAVYMTSRPYPIEMDDALTQFGAVTGGKFFSNIPFEPIVQNATVSGGDLYGAGVTYTLWPFESITQTGTVLGGDIYGSGVVYDDALPESITQTSTVLGGDLYGDGVTYDIWPFESITHTAIVTGGDLT
jgi:hypothetical protein